jgi:hypothetical protein
LRNLAPLAPLPALLIGIAAMRGLGVSRAAWMINIGATIFGLLIWFFARRLPPASRTRTLGVAVASIVTIAAPFAFAGMLGVHRWVSIGGLRLHAAAIVAPLIIGCVAAAAFTSAAAIAITATIIIALQPDAAQATSLAAACAVVLAYSRTTQTRERIVAIALLCVAAAVAFLRRDPLPPVAHVEEIFGIVAAKGLAWAALATIALALLPLPFLAAWREHRAPLALALGVYIALTLLAPAWGTFPVPVMGYGASPIVGYFVALALTRPRSNERGRAMDHL